MRRGGSRAAGTSKMECFVIIVNGFQPLTIITKHSILNVAAVLDPPLISEYVAIKTSDFPNNTNHMKCCNNGENEITPKRNKIYLTGHITLSKISIILAEKELCN